MSDSTVTLLILLAVIAVFAWNRLSVAVVAVATALSLWATDLLTLEEALAGFGDPVVVFIATLFVVSEGIDSTGVTSWVGDRVAKSAGSSRVRLMLSLMLLCAVLTSLLSLNGSVATLLPMVVAVAVRLGREPSQLLMPMVYAGSAGGMLVLMGSPVNVVVSDAAHDAGEGRFAFFEFAWVGVPLLLVTVGLGIVLSPRVLPQRRPASAPLDLSRHAETLAQHYGLPSSGLISAEHGVAEVVVPPRSELVGQTVRPGEVRASEVAILAVHRHGKDHGEGDVEVEPGDSLLVSGPWRAIDALADDREVLVVDCPDLLRRQTAPPGPKARFALAALGLMVVLLAFDVVPPAAAGLFAVAVMIFGGVVSSPQALRVVPWETLILIGGLIPLSVAVQTSGAGDTIAEWIVDVTGGGNPYVLLAALFVVTCVLGLVISNTATVLLMIPIGSAAAAETGTALPPVLMLIAVAASASLFTPVQTPGNLMVMGPGGYRFGDYWKLGLPIALAWFVVAIVVIPLVWPL